VFLFIRPLFIYCHSDVIDHLLCAELCAALDYAVYEMVVDLPLGEILTASTVFKNPDLNVESLGSSPSSTTYFL
jgi:hypothetical protein